MTKFSFDLVVPVYNEAEALPGFFSRLQLLPLDFQPIFVDNASTDNSLALLNGYPGAMIISHPTNEGYGSSIIDGIKAGTNERIVILDADGEYPIEKIPLLLQALQNHDVVYGSRFLDKSGGAQANMGWIRTAGNQAISNAFNGLFHQQVTDLYTGCKALKRSCLTHITLEKKGFEHVLELSAKLAGRGYRISEIGIDYHPRQTGMSKMHHIPETAKYFYWLLRYAQQHRAGKL